MSWLRVSALGIGSGIAFFIVFIYGPFLNHLEPNEVGLSWNMGSGEISLIGPGGWHASAPWVTVAKLDLRPIRVCMTSSAHAAVNCKLVQFIPEKYNEFAQIEGFRWYWWSNRFSINPGYNDEYRGFRDVMRGYAFSAEKYSFIKESIAYEVETVPAATP